jgi:hypothetical protein
MWLEGRLMNTLHGAMIGLALVLGGFVCSAEEATIPIRQIERDAQLPAKLTALAGGATIGRAYEMPSGSSSATGFVPAPRATAHPQTLSRGFFLINGLHLGMAAFDVGMTQHCLADHNCREGNPVMPSSLAGQLSEEIASVGLGTFVSYRLKKHGSKLWLLSPVVGIATHTVGVASGFAHY